MGTLLNPFKVSEGASFAVTKCIELGTASDYAYVNTPSVIPNIGSATVSVWVKFLTGSLPTPSTNGYGGAFFRVFGTAAGTPPDFILGARTRATGMTTPRFDLIARKQSNLDIDGMMGDTALSENAWYHFIIAGDGTSYRWRVDGVAEGYTSWAGIDRDGDMWGHLITSASYNFFFGSETGNSIPCRICQATIWDGKMTTAQMDELRTAGGKPADPTQHSLYLADSNNLKAYWPLGEGDTLTTLQDLSYLGNDMTATAGVTIVTDAP